MYDSSLRPNKNKVPTADGTLTLYSEEFGESYHSGKDGALNESLQKHINPAFTFKSASESLTILDICFGLGYNTLATLYEADRIGYRGKLHIISPEFDRELVESLGSFEYPEEFAPYREIIATLAREKYYSDDQWTIEVLIGDAREELPKVDKRFDIVYQDAFSPKKNPLLWTREYFALIRSLLREDGVLTTYSVASAVRMGLHENGFELFAYRGEKSRESMVASPSMLELEHIDMALKMSRNPSARSLRDSDFAVGEAI